MVGDEAACRSCGKIRLGQQSHPTRIKFGDYALSLLERKIRSGEIRSAKTREQWRYTLEHHLLPVFGQLYVDEIRRVRIEGWKDEGFRLVAADRT